MAEDKVPPWAWALVSILVAIILCGGTIIAAVIRTWPEIIKPKISGAIPQTEAIIVPSPTTEREDSPTATTQPQPTVVIAPTATQTVPPTTQPAGSVEQVPVLGYKDDGVTWCTDSDGTHTITYDSGAYSPFPTNDGCDPKGCWKSTVFIYKNSDPDAIFAGSSKGEPQNPDLRIGWDEWLTTEAEVETKTHHAHQELSIELKADDCLIFIAIDGRDAYHWPADNRGKVILNVYSP